MKILHIYKDYYPPVKGGIEGHINLLANNLVKRGFDIEVLVSNTHFKFEKENINGIYVYKIPQLGRIQSAPLNINFALWLRRLAANSDILHFHLPNPTAEISYLLSGLKKKVVVTYHSDIVRQVVLGKLYLPILNVFLRKVHAIIITSPNYLKSSKVVSRFSEKSHVIPLGINLKRFEPQIEDKRKIEELRKIHGTKLVIFIGRFRYYKGLHVLIKAMNKVNGKLLLIGTGPIEDELRKQILSFSLSEKIHFVGEVSDEELIMYLHACDVFVLPSILRSEAFGVVQLEAMACKKSVICTEINTGTSFVNQHQETGLVVPPSDPDTLADSINILLANPEIREKYGKAGFERVKKYFSIEKMVDDIVSIYQNMNLSEK